MLEASRAETKELRKRLQEQEIEAERHKEEQRVSFFKSTKFFDALSARSSSMLRFGFEGALRQCVQVGLIAWDSDLSTLDLKKMWDKLLPSEKVDQP